MNISHIKLVLRVHIGYFISCNYFLGALKLKETTFCEVDLNVKWQI